MTESEVGETVMVEITHGGHGCAETRERNRADRRARAGDHEGQHRTLTPPVSNNAQINGWLAFEFMVNML
jgi:hypothetical protein